MVLNEKVPVYINCLFFDIEDRDRVYVYRIEETANEQHPFHLFKQGSTEPHSWEDLSVHASLKDAIRVIIKELLPADEADQIYHGQASVDTQVILDRLGNGDKTVSIFYTADHAAFNATRDISFAEMIRRLG